MIKNLLTFFDTYSHYYIAGHVSPDGDCIGSQLALGSLLERKGKRVTLLSEGPFFDVSVRSYESLFSSNLKESLVPNSALVLADCSTIARIGKSFEELIGLPSAVIDHHLPSEEDEKLDHQLQYVDHKAVANCILVYRLFEELNIIPSKNEARFMLLGLITDTQFFRFVKGNDSEALYVASKLIQVGVSPFDIYNQINSGYRYQSRLVLAKILNSMFRLNDNKVLVCILHYEDYEYSEDIPQSYEIYRFLEGVVKIEIIVYIQEQKKGESFFCKVGLRATGNVDVSKIAKKFDGGGHKAAAGFSLECNAHTAKEVIKVFFDKHTS